MITGSVRWFDDANGFGFITPDDGSEDLFVHISTVNMSGLKYLKEKQKVCFEVTQCPDGGQVSSIKFEFAG
ncbi:MAG: cold-shock protein [Gallionella sp.]|nr:cold-shock protein [Gallionella sp.]